MKRVFLPVLSLFMVMAILVNTAGITVYNHFCLEENESSLSFSKLEKCCEDKKEVKQDKHACCKSKASVPAKNKIQKPGCCSQDEFSAQWQINEFSFKKAVVLNSTLDTLPLTIPEFRINYLVSFSNLTFLSPPILNSHGDLHSLYSVFLI